MAIGFDPARRRDGLGLRGIEERVKELHGAMTIGSGAGRRHDADDPPAVARRGRRRCRLRVLLADDHGIVRRGLRSLLEEAGLSGGRRSRRRSRGGAALRGASARPAHSRHRHAEAERHRGRRARAEARSAARRDHPEHARRRVVHHSRAGGRRARLPAEETRPTRICCRPSAPSPPASRSSARP